MDGQATITPAEQNTVDAQDQNKMQSPQTDTPKPEEPTEKVVSKDLFDRKVSELNKKNKELEAQLRAKMTDDERKAAETSEKEAELQSIKNELAALKTESALTAAGIKSDIAKELSAAIISADVSAIVEAVKSAVSAVEKDTKAKTAKELLENGSPKVQAAGGSREKPDPNIEIVKGAVAKPKSTPLSESKWFK